MSIIIWSHHLYHYLESLNNYNLVLLLDVIALTLMKMRLCALQCRIV